MTHYDRQTKQRTKGKDCTTRICQEINYIISCFIGERTKLKKYALL